ncbi:MAG: hypothetical protein WBD40_13260 [Tepidisphaeraceae bacterium]
MFWVIRWTDLKSGEDQAFVVEARSRAAAETIALKRDIPVVFLGEADDADIKAAREAKRLWRYTRETGRKCFGRPIGPRQLACIMLCGVWTIGVLLQSGGVLNARFPLALFG